MSRLSHNCYYTQKLAYSMPKQGKMRINHICDSCNIRAAEHEHHKFSQTKRNKRVYPEYIHHPDNILHLCYNCHEGSPEKPLVKWTEKEFCEHFNIEARGK